MKCKLQYNYLTYNLTSVRSVALWRPLKLVHYICMYVQYTVTLCVGCKGSYCSTNLVVSLSLFLHRQIIHLMRQLSGGVTSQ